MKTPDADDTIDWKEFLMLLKCFNIVGPSQSSLHITIERARQMFDEANLSEIADADVDRLCWHEYVEALGRIALEMYPLEDSSKSKSLNVDKAQVTFGNVGSMNLRVTTGMKSAVESAFHGGKTAHPPINSKKIFKQLSPRAKLFRDKGWYNSVKQQDIGTVKWGRDTYVHSQRKGTFGKVLSMSEILVGKKKLF